jgi:DNA-binding Lrp family transcriptional regulator
MVRAFIMVKTGAGESEATVTAVRDIESVVEAHVVAGEFDVIAEVDAPEVYDVLHTASSSIQGLDGVVDTKTYFALDD